MFRKHDKSQIWRLTGMFFAGMLLFTLLSRAAYQHGTAVVSTQSPGSGTIGHSVFVTGKTVQNQERAVTTVGGLRVADVCVNEGQQVRAGEVLFTLDMDYLEETIVRQKQDMQKQRLTVQDAWSQNYAASQRRSNQQAQAEENYAVAVTQGETALERAKRTLERAKKALKNFQNGVTGDAALEAELVQQCRETQEDYQAAQNALEQLRQEVERRVQEAVEQAKQEASQPTESQPPAETTQPPEETTQPPAETTQPPEETTQPPEETTQPPAETTQPPAETTQPPEETTQPPEETTQPPEETTQPPAETTQPPAETTRPEVQPAARAGMEQPRLVFLSAASTVDLEAVAAAVRQSYARQLSDAQTAAEQAKKAMEDAQAELERFYAQQSGGAAPTEQELLDNLEKAQQGYDDALAALNNAKTTYGRAIQSAALPDGSDNSARIGQIQYDQMALALDKLEALQKAQGEIPAPVDGIVTRCQVQTGEKTTDNTVVLLADLSRGCKFSGLVTQEQSRYIGVGDKVTLRFDSTGKEYRDLSVTTLSATAEDGGGYRLTVQLPPDMAALGAGAELRFTRKSQPYGCCVPVSSLHLDEKNQPYVLVVEPVASVLGTQMQARKVPVTVLEQNESMAALAEGTLHREQKVIVHADRAVDAGSRVRVA